MAQSVIVKKGEKVQAVFAVMKNQDDFSEFSSLFKSMFPKDWERIIQRYRKHELLDKKGRGHPMPNPEKYLSNMFKVYRAKYKR